jgi:hypothetical protein
MSPKSWYPTWPREINTYLFDLLRKASRQYGLVHFGLHEVGVRLKNACICSAILAFRKWVQSASHLPQWPWIGQTLPFTASGGQPSDTRKKKGRRTKNIDLRTPTQKEHYAETEGKKEDKMRKATFWYTAKTGESNEESLWKKYLVPVKLKLEKSFRH